jgi:hypothetical protein
MDGRRVYRSVQVHANPDEHLWELRDLIMRRLAQDGAYLSRIEKSDNGLPTKAAAKLVQVVKTAKHAACLP